MPVLLSSREATTRRIRDDISRHRILLVEACVKRRGSDLGPVKPNDVTVAILGTVRNGQTIETVSGLVGAFALAKSGTDQIVSHTVHSDGGDWIR